MRNVVVGPFVICVALAVFIAAEVRDAPIGPAFSCRGRSPGYYADMETNCQDYHMCDAGGRRYTYSCPNQTRFQQRVMICDHWFMVDCSLSETHFDANLLIGQKDKHFVEHFQQEDGHSGREESSYSSPSPSFGRNHSRTQAANEIKKNFLPSVTKKILEEKNASVKYTEIKFSASTSAIKPTTERGLAKEFANNPFFGSLTQAPYSGAGKGERGSLTFHQRKDQAVTPTVSSLSHKPRVTPPVRQTTPPLRNVPASPNYEQRRTSTVLPLTRDYGFVTREGQSNLLTQTEPPRLFRNNLSKVVEITNFGTFTTEPPLTTQYESLKTRERIDVRAPLPLTRAPPSPSRVPPTLSVQPNRTQVLSPDGGVRPPNATQRQGGLQRTPGGFRYVTQEVSQAQGPTSFGVQRSSGADVSTGTGFASGPELKKGGEPPTGPGLVTGKGFPTGSGVSPWNGFSTGSDVSTWKGFPSSSGVSTGKDIPTGSDASGKGFPTGSGVSTWNGFPSSSSVSTGKGISTGSDVSTGKGAPTGSGVSTWKGFPTSSGVSTGKETPTGSDVQTGKGISTGSDVSTETGKGFLTKADFSTRSGLPTGLDISFGSAFPSGSDVSTGSDIPTGPDVSLENRFSSGAGVSFDKFSSNPSEDEEDLNTVEVRIPDPRRMFFIPDSAAREAEMLNSTNETVLRISLPSLRHHGPMRFKGVRGAKGRRPDCPQCHPAFLVPGSCEPCVLIRR